MGALDRTATFVDKRFGQLLPVIYGRKSIQQIGQLLKGKVTDVPNISARRALVISDVHSENKLSRRHVVENLRASNIEVYKFHWAPNEAYSGAEPLAATVAQAVTQFRNTGCDAVVGVGCDVSIAIAKATATLGPSRFRAPDLFGGFVREDYVGLTTKPLTTFSIPSYPLVTVPVHGCSGDESSANVSIMDWDKQDCLWLHGPRVLPKCTLVDPNLLEIDEEDSKQVLLNGTRALYRVIDVMLSNDGLIDGLAMPTFEATDLLCEALKHETENLIEPLKQSSSSKRQKLPALASKSFDRLLLGSLCAGVASTQFSTELQSVVLGTKVHAAADLEPVEAIKHSTLYQIIVSAFIRTFPVREIDVGLALFLPCMKHELQYLQDGVNNNKFDFEPLFNYADTRLGKVQEVDDCVLLVVPEAGTALEWFAKVHAKLGVKGLDEHMELPTEDMTVFVERVLAVAHRCNVPADKSLIHSIVEEACLKTPFADDDDEKKESEGSETWNTHVEHLS